MEPLNRQYGVGHYHVVMIHTGPEYFGFWQWAMEAFLVQSFQLAILHPGFTSCNNSFQTSITFDLEMTKVPHRHWCDSFSIQQLTDMARISWTLYTITAHHGLYCAEPTLISKIVTISFTVTCLFSFTSSSTVVVHMVHQAIMGHSLQNWCCFQTFYTLGHLLQGHMSHKTVRSPCHQWGDHVCIDMASVLQQHVAHYWQFSELQW